MVNPYGGELKELILDEDQFCALEKKVGQDSFILQQSDVFLLMNIATGALSPLTGFMNESEYKSVLNYNQLENGLNWTIPILFHISENQAIRLKTKTFALLKDKKLETIGIIQISDIFTIDPLIYAKKIFDTTDTNHPGVALFFGKENHCIGGTVYIKEPEFVASDYFKTPHQHRDIIREKGFQTITAFSTRNICHIGHEYLHRLALESTDALGINVITGAQVNGSIKPDIIFETYDLLARKYYPYDRMIFNNLRMPPIYAGPKEAFLQAVILQNYGYTHFIVGRDHAGVGDYYKKYASQHIFKQLNSLNIKIMAISEPRFCILCDQVTTQKSCPHNRENVVRLNGREVRQWIQGDGENKSLLKKVLRKELRQYFDNRISYDKRLNKVSLSQELEKIFFRLES